MPEKLFRPPLSCAPRHVAQYSAAERTNKETTPRFPQRILKKAARSGTTTAASATLPFFRLGMI